MIGGNKNIQLKKYKDLLDVEKILSAFFQKEFATKEKRQL